MPAPPPVAELLGTADLAKGEAVFVKACQKCHYSEPASGNFVGPSLWNIVGKKRGAVEGYKYSAALREAGGDWSMKISILLFLIPPAPYPEQT